MTRVMRIFEALVRKHGLPRCTCGDTCIGAGHAGASCAREQALDRLWHDAMDLAQDATEDEAPQCAVEFGLTRGAQ